MQNLPVFVGATLLLAMTPGQDFIYIMIRSASQGVRVGLIAIAGLMIGVMFHTLAAATGVAAILLASSYAFNVIKFLGAAYLIYLGIQAIRQKGKLEIKQRKDKASDLKILKEGMLSSILNPKLALFFMAFLPQFVSPDENAFTQMLLLGILFGLLSLPILMSVALLSAKFGNFLINNQTVSQSIARVTGLVLIALGVSLGLTER